MPAEQVATAAPAAAMPSSGVRQSGESTRARAAVQSRWSMQTRPYAASAKSIANVHIKTKAAKARRGCQREDLEPNGYGSLILKSRLPKLLGECCLTCERAILEPLGMIMKLFVLISAAPSRGKAPTIKSCGPIRARIRGSICLKTWGCPSAGYASLLRIPMSLHIGAAHVKDMKA